MFIKFAYTIFIGILVATFVGVGIAAFFPEPKYPQTPLVAIVPMKTTSVQLANEEITSTEAARMNAQNRESERINSDFQKVLQNYNKNASILSLTFAIAILLISLTLLRGILYIADGILLGGIFTLLYSIVRGFGTDDNMFRFVIVSIGLVIALVLGYIKLTKPSTKKSLK